MTRSLVNYSIADSTQMASQANKADDIIRVATGETELKRRRVAKACRNCRQQKAKCDGRYPMCNRCEGYGHKCLWSNDKRNRSHDPDNIETRHSSDTSPSVSSLGKAVQLYDKILHSIRRKLSAPDRVALDLTLSHIRRQLPEDVLSLLTAKPASDASLPVPQSPCDSRKPSTEGQSYVGQASDTWVFNAIKEILQDKEPLQSPLENAIQSYSQDTTPLNREMPPELPKREIADTYVDIYFFTIHIAYPFVNKPSFLAQYETFWTSGLIAGEGEDSWLSLLYTIFAIGAYYSSFPRSKNDESQTHLGYFEQAVSLGESIMTDCTIANVQALLAQCFFLLATGQIDRCWKILGLAIRVGQSVGLHVDDRQKRPSTNASAESQEEMRRTWYSMYVLDRLVALQLGRPAAIHEDDYRVNLPSRAGESVSGEDQPRLANHEPSSIDYFLSVINFSKILGQVINDLYSPSQTEVHPDEMLLRTTALDRKLAEWKLNLLRHLRFDLGHTFEQSVVFRRQRNMLAIKFHHLRALIHRPYLCLTWLQRHNCPLIALLQRAQHQVEQFQRICVLEAQNMAHLLHNVADERSLVHDFPWWQMISCLICGSSILLVASAYIESDGLNTDLHSQTLNEDAETCLKVFDALSANSGAARRARDMMNALKRSRILAKYQVPLGTDMPFMHRPDVDNALHLPLMRGIHKDAVGNSLDYDIGQDSFTWQTWPGELSDAMMWSAQFIDPTGMVNNNGESSSAKEVPRYAPAEENGQHESLS